MQRSLLLLLLMGQSPFFMCQVHQYHFINEARTWGHARYICRKRHTNLATVPNARFATKLLKAGPGNAAGAWIGLDSDNSRWQWSLPGVEFDDDMWAPNEPDNSSGGNSKNCVNMHTASRKWRDNDCSVKRPFICYNGTTPDKPSFHWVPSPKPWSDAQRYCRDKYTDLISGLHQLQHPNALDSVPTAQKWMWIGLFRNPRAWTWSDDSDVSYTNWESDTDAEQSLSGSRRCATVETSSGKWTPDNCLKTKPFFCYTDRTVVMQEKLSWDDAVAHCQKNKMNLVSITSCDDGTWIEKKAKEATTRYIWLGLRYSCFLDLWFWVNDRALRYKNWAPGQQEPQCDTAVAIDKENKFEWVKRSDEEKYNFICSQ